MRTVGHGLGLEPRPADVGPVQRAARGQPVDPLGHGSSDHFGDERGRLLPVPLPHLAPDLGVPTRLEKGARALGEKLLPVLGGLSGASALAAYLIGTGGIGIFPALVLALLVGGTGGGVANRFFRWGNDRLFGLPAAEQGALLAHAKSLGSFQHSLMGQLLSLPRSKRPDNMAAVVERMRKGKLEPQDILGKGYASKSFSDAESRFFNQYLVPAARGSTDPAGALRAILQGHSVEMNDRGFLYEQIRNLGGANMGGSSHRVKFDGLGILSAHVIKGRNESNKTWFKLDISKRSWSNRVRSLLPPPTEHAVPIRLDVTDPRIRLGEMHAAYGFVFEDPNPISNFDHYQDMRGLNPTLYGSYSRRNAQGDGSCWLTSGLYVGLDQAFRSSESWARFIEHLDRTKAGFQREYPDHGVELLAEFRQIATEMRGLPERDRADFMLRPEVSGVMRRFSRELIAIGMKDAGGAYLPRDIETVLTPNTEGGIEELGILSRALGFSLYAIDGVNATHQGKYALLNLGNPYDHQPDMGAIARDGSKLLMFSRGHYAILEPTQ